MAPDQGGGIVITEHRTVGRVQVDEEDLCISDPHAIRGRLDGRKLILQFLLISIALGLKPKQVGVHENISDSLGFLREKGIA